MWTTSAETATATAAKDRPTHQNTQLPKMAPRDPVDLRIDAAWQVFWNGQATDRAGLDALMREQGRAAPMQQALLRIDANGDCDYQSVAQVLAMARNAGLAKIGFVQD